MLMFKANPVNCPLEFAIASYQQYADDQLPLGVHRGASHEVVQRNPALKDFKYIALRNLRFAGGRGLL